MSMPSLHRGAGGYVEQVVSAVTALFVPGDQAARFGKAVSSGAHVVIIDLEDAVAPVAKEGALENVVEALSASNDQGMSALVRINSSDSEEYASEIAALLSLAGKPGSGLMGLMVPKAEDADTLGRLRAIMPSHLALVPLIETAKGVVNALGIASVPGVSRLAFGAIDFALDIDSSGDDRFLDYPRSQLVIASKAAGIAAPLDSPATEIRDSSRIAESAKLAQNFGFGGKLCIHPAQLSAVTKAFTPTEHDIQWALSVTGVEDGAVQIDGKMIDRPVIERAKRIVQRAGLA